MELELDEEPDGGGRRRAKALRNRRALEEHALRLFGERGYEGVTVPEIAEAALLSPRTFFRYYASKEEVVFAREREYVRHVRDEIARRPDDEPPRLALARALLSYAEMLQGERDELLPRMHLLSRNPDLLAKGLLFQRYLELEVAEELARRMGEPLDVGKRALAATFAGALAAASMEWFLCEGERPYHEVLAEAFTELGLEY